VGGESVVPSDVGLDDEGDLAGVVAGVSYVEGLVRFCCWFVELVGHADVEPVEHVVVHDLNNLVRGDWVDERVGLHVQCDRDECVGYWCGCSVGCCGSIHGAGCADRGVGNLECEHPVGCVMDCTRKRWWCFDQFVHGEVVGCSWDFYDESVGSVGC